MHIAFDLDNTLVDADALHKNALNEALQQFGYWPITEQEHHEIFKGLPTKHKLAMLFEMGRVGADELDTIKAEKQARTMALIKRDIKPDKHVQALLLLLKRLGYSLCVCSNAVRASVAEMLACANIMPFIDFFLSNEDAIPKPAPDIYIKAANLFCIPTKKLIVVEDAAPGKAAALAAGCSLVEVNSPVDCSPLLMPKIHEAALFKGERRTLAFVNVAAH